MSGQLVRNTSSVGQFSSENYGDKVQVDNTTNPPTQYESTRCQDQYSFAQKMDYKRWDSILDKLSKLVTKRTKVTQVSQTTPQPQVQRTRKAHYVDSD